MIKQAIRALAVLAMVAVGSAEAGTVTLRWDPNPEPDIAGYIVSMGTASGQYSSSADIGNQTSFQTADLDLTRTYYFSVQAYNTAGIRSAPSAEVSTTALVTPLSLTSITTSVASPQILGATVTFAAAANGGVAPYRYKWRIFNGATWALGSDWTSSNQFAWTPTVANASYRVGVWIRSATSVADAPDNPSSSGDIPYSIQPVPVVQPEVLTTSIVANKSAPQLSGAKIMFTASAVGASAVQYKWWVFDGLTWVVAQEWSTSNRFSWTPKTANPLYQVLVRAQSATNTALSAGASMPFPINNPGGKPGKSASLTTSKKTTTVLASASTKTTTTKKPVLLASTSTKTTTAKKPAALLASNSTKTPTSKTTTTKKSASSTGNKRA
ncbi:MAG TPA: fibronectin type III domain-containing protein [Vicinamibacterales bacterium]|nr:fibronectin type III domain-containing protein [Vicinamibacterales bacterium]